MQIQINAADFKAGDALTRFVMDEVEDGLKHHAEQLTRVEVHLKDLNSSEKSGLDKHALIEARPRGQKPLVAEDTAEDIYDAVRNATSKLDRVLETHFGKLHDKRQPHRP